MSSTRSLILGCLALWVLAVYAIIRFNHKSHTRHKKQGDQNG